MAPSSPTLPPVPSSTMCHALNPSQKPDRPHLLYLFHSAIRVTATRLLDASRTLAPLAPDAHLDDLQRRLNFLRNTLHAHCNIEDNTVLPVLRDALQSAQPPWKRPRTSNSSPNSVHLQTFEHEHLRLDDAFRSLCDEIALLRPSPVENVSAFQCKSQTSAITRGQRIISIKEKTARLCKMLYAHLHSEEINILPIFNEYLSPSEQVRILLRVTEQVLTVPQLPEAFGLVPEEDLISLFRYLSNSSSQHHIKRMATALERVLSAQKWLTLCKHVPQLVNIVAPKRNSLMEIIYIHRAISRELADLVAHCEGIEITNHLQIQALIARCSFLQRVHACHADGEENVVMKELVSKLNNSPINTISSPDAFQEEHEDESALFDKFSEKLTAFQTASKSPSCNIPELKAELIKSVRQLSNQLMSHMNEEETKLLPLVRQHFSIEDQDRLMCMVMAKIPADFLQQLVPWMFSALSVDEQESMLRNVLRISPRNEASKIVGSLAQSVRKGMTDRMEWNEICLRIPEIETKYNAIVEGGDEASDGPVSEILRVHKAFRIELHALLRRAKEIPVDGSVPNPRSLASLAESVAFLQKMVADHSKAEDNILLPRLEQRVPGIADQFKDEHGDEAALFRELAACLEELQCASEEVECERLIQRSHALARTLRDEMVAHLDQEEKQLWPLLKEHFSAEEQSEIVALIFGQMPENRLRELLPWMIRLLSVSERNTMMNHILQVTRSTMFEKWLKTWLPYEPDEEKTMASENADVGKNEKATEAVPETMESRVNTSINMKKVGGVNAAQILLNGRENVERTLRSIAKDESLSVDERRHMMQQVMLVPFNAAQAARTAERDRRRKEDDDLSATYTTDKNGVRRLGCKHYTRACKIRASCCNRLYNCRLCHDGEQTHIMNRTKTKEILCMRCGTLQPIGANCVNKKCGKRMAKYFCRICVFYDDDDSRSVYHCHSCNVCRVGKGLGQDFFHCMKCNQCMSMKYQHKGHVCIERAMESDCPVCHQYLFTSTSPVKYLGCGHLMHTSCYDRYAEDNIGCPVCGKSLDAMRQVFEQLDQQLSVPGAHVMPAEYRSVRCDIMCLDCSVTSNTAYHFVYNKCPHCGSYNTRVDRIDARAGHS